MEGQTCARVLELEVRKRHIADHGVDAAFRETRIAEVFNTDVLARMQHAGDTPRQAVELHTDETHPRWGMGHEVADPAARL